MQNEDDFLNMDPEILLQLSARRAGEWLNLSGGDVAPSPVPNQPILKGLNIADPAWRAYCLDQMGRFPSGYTYLGQMLGHDIGHSVNIDLVPHTEKDGSNTSAEAVVAYNLIENPLTLETVYGSGPSTLHHLFDPRTGLFRLPDQIGLSKALAGDDVRALYDVRNRDTLMIHQIVTVWMWFHNTLAKKLDPTIDKVRYGVNHPNRSIVYRIVRKHVVETWHRVIQQDLLARYVHPEIMKKPISDHFEGLEAEIFNVPDATLLHGIFRSLHALPRGFYQLKKPRDPKRLASLRANLPKISDGEHLQWRFDLYQFFQDSGSPLNQTGISPSVTIGLAGIVQRDRQSAYARGAARWNNGSIKEIRDKITADWGRQIKAKSLADFLAKFSDTGGFKVSLTAKEFEDTPLYICLMIEAAQSGVNGSLGKFGSLLFRKAIEERIQEISFGKIDPDESSAFYASNLPKFSTMKDIIKYTEDQNI